MVALLVVLTVVSAISATAVALLLLLLVVVAVATVRLLVAMAPVLVAATIAAFSTARVVARAVASATTLLLLGMVSVVPAMVVGGVMSMLLGKIRAMAVMDMGKGDRLLQEGGRCREVELRVAAGRVDVLSNDGLFEHLLKRHSMLQGGAHLANKVGEVLRLRDIGSHRDGVQMIEKVLHHGRVGRIMRVRVGHDGRPTLIFTVEVHAVPRHHMSFEGQCVNISVFRFHLVTLDEQVDILEEAAAADLGRLLQVYHFVVEVLQSLMEATFKYTNTNDFRHGL